MRKGKVRRSLVCAMLMFCAGLAVSSCASYYAQQNTLPHAYLEQALQAVHERDAPKALAALDQAENAWIGRNVPFTDAFFNFDPDAMREMARARQSIQMGRWGDADYYIRAALTHPSTIVPG
jgi:uncharacterized lipoprotein YbaY